MEADEAAGDGRKPESPGHERQEPPNPLGYVEIALQVVCLYIQYKHDEAATYVVTALIEIIRMMRR